MKKHLLTFAVVCMSTMAAFSQTQTISLKDGISGTNTGTYAPGSTFTINVFLTLSGYNAGGVGLADGLSYWLQANSAIAPFISITSNTYFTFTNSNQPQVPKVFSDVSGASAGNRSDLVVGVNSGDLGATANVPAEDRGNGTFQVTSLTFSLSLSAPAGPFTISTTTLSPKTSAVNDTPNFSSFAIPQSNYTLNVSAVPEPATWSLIALSGLGTLGVNLLRRSRRS